MVPDVKTFTVWNDVGVSGDITSMFYLQSCKVVIASLRVLDFSVRYHILYFFIHFLFIFLFLFICARCRLLIILAYLFVAFSGVPIAICRCLEWYHLYRYFHIVHVYILAISIHDVQLQSCAVIVRRAGLL